MRKTGPSFFSPIRPGPFFANMGLLTTHLPSFDPTFLSGFYRRFFGPLGDDLHQTMLITMALRLRHDFGTADFVRFTD
jgi:hypothetical protein